MPPKKGKKGKKKSNGKRKTEQVGGRDLLLKETDAQEYAQVLKNLGNSRFEVLCFDGKTRLAHVRGKMRRRAKLATDDIILLSLRDFQDDKADIIWAYSLEEAKQLKKQGEIPESTRVHDTKILESDDSDDGEVTFETI